MIREQKSLGTNDINTRTEMQIKYTDLLEFNMLGCI